MSVEYRGIVALGDQWLRRAEESHRGGAVGQAAAEAALASAHYTRAMLQKPDTLGAMLANAAQRERNTIQLEEQIAASMTRHPAGRKRGNVTGAPLPDATADYDPSKERVENRYQTEEESDHDSS